MSKAKKAKKAKKSKKKVVKKSSEKTTHKDKSKSKKKVVKKRRISLCSQIWDWFDKVGVDEVTYDDCKAFALKAKPDSKFNKNHFSWYKNKYREQQEEGKR